MKSTAIRLGLTAAVVLFLTACSGQANGLLEPLSSTESSVASGCRLIASYGCGSCHSIPGVPGADAMAVPPLNRFYERTYIAGRLPNTEEDLVRWIQNPQQIIPGNAMPDLGVTSAEAHDIAAYLYHQPSIVDLINH